MTRLLRAAPNPNRQNVCNEQRRWRRGAGSARTPPPKLVARSTDGCGTEEAVGTRRIRWKRFQHAAVAAPRLTFTAFRRGVLPIAPAAVSTARREGVSELHWKVLGDGLVRFLRSSGSRRP